MRHPYDKLTVIATPREGMAHCATKEKYAQAHLQQMRDLQNRFPDLGYRDPWPETDGAVPFVMGGKWIVRCECGDAPMASPEWNEARCFACGAVYRKLQWPPQKDAIAEALLARPSAVTRAWLPGETVAELRQQNKEHGLPNRRRAL